MSAPARPFLILDRSQQNALAGCLRSFERAAWAMPRKKRRARSRAAKVSRRRA